jgi:hypothetical protein
MARSPRALLVRIRANATTIAPGSVSEVSCPSSLVRSNPHD